MRGSTGSVSLACRSPVNGTPAIGRLAPPPSPGTGLIVGAAPELSTTFAPTLLSCSAYGSCDGRPHADRADLRPRGTCARRSRVWVEDRDVRVLVKRAGPERWRRPPRTRCWDPGGQVQMAQNALDDRRLFDERDQPEAPPTARTGQDIKTKRSAHEVRPAPCLLAGRSPLPPAGRVERTLGGAGLAGGGFCTPAGKRTQQRLHETQGRRVMRPSACG